MSEDGTYLVPVVVAGGADYDIQAWLLEHAVPARWRDQRPGRPAGEPVWTSDYLADPRIPHEPRRRRRRRAGLRLCGDGRGAAARTGRRGHRHAGRLVGASRAASTPEELDLLQGLADQAAIAITNSTLLARLSESEERYRYLVENAPDLVWSIEADGRLTFLSDAVERLTGRRPDDSVGQHFGALVHGSSRDIAEFDLAAGMELGSQEVRGRVNLLGRDGEPVPAEFIATAWLDENGQFAGANGSRPRHARARPSRTRPPGVGVALPVPRRELARRRLLDRRRGQLHVRLGRHGADDRLVARPS